MAVATRLARAEKTAATTTKFALREAIGTILPHETIDQAQRGFAAPIGQWFRGELSGFAEQVIREARTEDWLDKRAVLDVLRRFRADDPEVTWRQLWVLVVFSLWHQIYVERVFDPVAQGWQTVRSAQPGRAQLPATPASATPPPAAGNPPTAAPAAPPHSARRTPPRRIRARPSRATSLRLSSSHRRRGHRSRGSSQPSQPRLSRDPLSRGSSLAARSSPALSRPARSRPARGGPPSPREAGTRPRGAARGSSGGPGATGT